MKQEMTRTERLVSSITHKLRAEEFRVTPSKQDGRCWILTNESMENAPGIRYRNAYRTLCELEHDGILENGKNFAESDTWEADEHIVSLRSVGTRVILCVALLENQQVIRQRILKALDGSIELIYGTADDSLLVYALPHVEGQPSADENVEQQTPRDTITLTIMGLIDDKVLDDDDEFESAGSDNGEDKVVWSTEYVDVTLLAKSTGTYLVLKTHPSDESYDDFSDILEEEEESEREDEASDDERGEFEDTDDERGNGDNEEPEQPPRRAVSYQKPRKSVRQGRR